jgi:hypothetical protein
VRPSLFAGWVALAALVGASCGLPEVAAVGTNVPDGGVKLAGCRVDGGAPPVAPGGYYTNGATACGPGAEPHVFHGVDRPSLEWLSTGDHLSVADFALWGAGTRTSFGSR